jgi:apolipoprotein N-acyltransferase
MAKVGALTLLFYWAGFTLGIGVAQGDGWTITIGVLLYIGSAFYYHRFVRPEEND